MAKEEKSLRAKAKEAKASVSETRKKPRKSKEQREADWGDQVEGKR